MSTETQVKHTPTPWGARGSQIVRQANRGGHVIFIAELFRDVGAQCCIENADFIVKAVNSHYDLLSALKELTEDFETWLIDHDFPPETQSRLKVAHDAIQKAEAP
jgi:hypothetical protein